MAPLRWLVKPEYSRLEVSVMAISSAVIGVAYVTDYFWQTVLAAALVGGIVGLLNDGIRKSILGGGDQGS